LLGLRGNEVTHLLVASLAKQLLRYKATTKSSQQSRGNEVTHLLVVAAAAAALQQLQLQLPK